MNKSYSWQEIANMPLCCVCCGSRNVSVEDNLCLEEVESDDLIEVN